MLDKNRAWQVLREADLVCSEQEVGRAVERVAAEVTAMLADANPLVLSVMGGAVVFTGRLLPLLHFRWSSIICTSRATTARPAARK
jgi:hypoxanthine phosphoribosyltransferase